MRKKYQKPIAKPEQPIIHYVAVEAEEPAGAFDMKPPMPQSFDYKAQKWVDSCEIWNQYNTPTRPTGSRMALDSRIAFDNQFAGAYGGGYANNAASYMTQTYRLIVNAPYVGQNTLMQFSQNNLLATICQKKADRLTGKWIEFVSNNTKDNKASEGEIIKKIKQLEDECERLELQQWVRKSAEDSYKFGGCLLYPKLKGDTIIDQHGIKEREEELLIGKIGIGDLERFQVIKPWTITGINWVSDDPFSEWFYKPERWLVMGKVIHTSRVAHFVYNEMPDYLKPTYQFMGLSLSQKLIYDMNHYLTAKNEQIKISQKLKFMILENVDLRALANNQSQNGTLPISGRVQIAQQQLKNGDLITLGGEEKMSNLNFDVGNMPEVVRQNAELMCATAGMSALELFGFTPNGFSSVSEFEKESNNDKVRDDQKNMLHANIKWLLKIIMMNLWGKIDERITFKWVNLETPNPKEEAEIQAIKARVDIDYMNSGVISEKTVIDRLNSDPESGYDGLELDSLSLEPSDFAETNRENEQN